MNEPYSRARVHARFRPLLWSLLFAPTLVSCDQEAAEEARDRAELVDMRAQILAAVGDGSDDVSDCRYIGLGDKPCGGFWQYLVYSVSATDTVALRTMVANYNAFENAMNRKYGYASDCSVPRPPVLERQEGRCVDAGR